MPDKDMMVKANTGGWLLIRLDTGTEVSLPEFCHVKFHKSAAGRDSVTIQEGPHAKKAASVKSGFLTDRKHAAKALVTFYLRSNVLTWQGGPATQTVGAGITGGIASFTDPRNKVPAGLWDIEMPDFPHDLGRGYIALSGHALSWFRIAAPNSKDRYIHPGTISAGCTTVGISGDKTSAQGQSALKDYEKLYAYLIARRKSAGVVGQIQVQDM